MINCKNCSKLYEGSFCPSCGQKYISKRYTTKESILWLFSSIFNLEKGFVYTTKQLIISPGKVIKEFLDGVTVRYSHPFRFLFIWASISAILTHYTTALEDSSTIFGTPENQTGNQLAFQNDFLGLMKNYMSFYIMGMVPLLSMASYLVFKRKKFNYAEHLIINAYGNASSIYIGLPVTFLYFVMEDTKNLPYLALLLSFVVISRVYAKSFNDNYVIAALKYIVSFVLSMLMFMIIFVIGLIIYLIYLEMNGLENPFKPVAS